MQAVVKGSPSFAYIELDLDPGESVTAESDAMSSMAADLELKTSFNGGCLGGLMKKFLGGESLFVNTFTNRTNAARRLVLVQKTPGDIRQMQLDGGAICLQPGAYIASTPGLKLGLSWGGIGSFLAKEGLFKLMVSGTGTLWFGAYGGMVDKEIRGHYIIDTAHLVAYPPGMKLKTQLAGGLLSSFFGGEGLVTRVEGTGTVILQTRSLHGLVGWLNPKL
jgi:uncharacterized protein (TIGR00266 family)